MALVPLEPCPHCPVTDPLQRLLESTRFYDDDDSSDEDEAPADIEKPKSEEICRKCGRMKSAHPPPYGPWCSLERVLLPPPPPPPRLRRFRADRLQPLVDACLGTGSVGSAFLALYRQRKFDGGGEDVFNLVVKRIGTTNEDFFEDVRKSLDPTTAMEDKITALNHIHLIKVYGIIGGNKLVMERAPYGPLSDFLLQDSTRTSMNCHHLLYAAFQAAAAMAYLEKSAVVHGRLAARNILVSEVSKCRRWIHIKLSDYGIPFDSDASRESRLPWTSPEELISETASSYSSSSPSSPSSSTSSDSWSFGVVLHEIFTYGKKPYYGLNFVTLRKWIPQGYRMLQDPLVPDNIYSMMLSSWDPASLRRPSFRRLESRLWSGVKEVTPDFLCRKCRDAGIAGGLGTRNG